MKQLKLNRYQTKIRDGVSSERWGVSMFFPKWEATFDERLASLTTEQVEKLGISTDADEMELRGNPAEQAIAMQLNQYLTGKISSEKMAGKTEKEVLAYCERNFLKVIAEAKSNADKISEAVATEAEWFTKKAEEMADLFVAGKTKEALAIQAEIKARRKPSATS